MTENSPAPAEAAEGMPAPALTPDFLLAHAFVRIEGGKVVEVTTSRWDLKAHTRPELVWVDVSDLAQVPAMGASYDATAKQFTAPAPVVVKPRTTMTPLEFMGRLTPEEDGKIATAAQGNAQILLFLLSMSAATIIDLVDPRTIGGVNALAAAGLISSDRAKAILTP